MKNAWGGGCEGGVTNNQDRGRKQGRIGERRKRGSMQKNPGDKSSGDKDDAERMVNKPRKQGDLVPHKGVLMGCAQHVWGRQKEGVGTLVRSPRKDKLYQTRGAKN